VGLRRSQTGAWEEVSQAGARSWALIGLATQFAFGICV
jgi:hypothetical protein